MFRRSDIWCLRVAPPVLLVSGLRGACFQVQEERPQDLDVHTNFDNTLKNVLAFVLGSEPTIASGIVSSLASLCTDPGISSQCFLTCASSCPRHGGLAGLRE